MTLIRVLLERHIQVVRLAKKEVISVQEFQDMRDTWNCIFWALDRRLDVLQQVWRQQRLDPEAQVESYNGGLFEAWYDLVRLAYYLLWHTGSYKTTNRNSQ